MVKTYNCKQDKGWYVHISKWRGIYGAHLLFRGDSDPVVMSGGRFISLPVIEDYVCDFYDDYKCSLSGGEKPMSIEDFYNDDYFMQDVLDTMLCCEYKKLNQKGKDMNKKKTAWKGVKNLTAEEKKIRRLQSKLTDCKDMLEEIKLYCVDGEYDAHHCNFYTVNETIDDYQVLRKFDIEVEPIDPLDKATPEELKEYEREERENNGFYDNAFEAICERLYDETGDAFHEFEYGEVAQTWINIKTGNVIRLGRVFDKDTSCCDFDAPWEVINNEAEDKVYEKEVGDLQRAAAFSRTFFNSYLDAEYTHHDDISVHPMLLQRGYKPIDASNYCPIDVRYDLTVLDDDCQMYISLMEQYTMEDVVRAFVDGGEQERLIKMWMADRDLLMLREKIKTEYREQFDTAIKIVARKHYNIEDKSIYADMFNAMCELGKDIHNPFYVCPTDFKDMHDKMAKSLDRQRKKIAEQRRKEEMQKEIEKALANQEYYDALVKRYGDVHIKNDKYDIFLCPSINAMADEGEAMHHCVFKMGYYKPEHNCLILLCRDANDINKRISTIEVNTNTWSIVQNRGVCNSVPEGLDEINELIKSNIKLFKKANRRKQEKTIVTMPMAA